MPRSSQTTLHLTVPTEQSSPMQTYIHSAVYKVDTRDGCQHASQQPTRHSNLKFSQQIRSCTACTKCCPADSLIPYTVLHSLINIYAVVLGCTAQRNHMLPCMVRKSPGTSCQVGGPQHDCDCQQSHAVGADNHHGHHP